MEVYVAALADLELLSHATALEDARRHAHARARLRGSCIVWRVHPTRLEAVEEVDQHGQVQSLLVGLVRVRP